MKHLNAILLATLVVLMFSASCKKDEPDDPIIPHEEEVITTLRYSLIHDTVGIPVVLSFQDLDGDGGNPPVVTADTLRAHTTYSGSLTLLNELETPAENITEEIEEEASDHQFFFQSTLSNLIVEYDDADEDGYPVGLSTTLTTGSPGSGTITIILRHEPEKDAAGVASGDIANAGGETDIEVTFNVDVK
ncbi:MAG: type 1 periplasmic binding fold superfamily protein [Bacteroidia bacterium]